MTTLVYRDGVLAADSLVTVGRTRLPGPMKKITRMPNGSLYGFAGSVAAGTGLLNALLSAEEEEEERLPVWDDDGTGVVIDKETGKVLIYEGSGGFFVSPGPYHAFGSGAEYAYGALAMGATAPEAVKVAIKFDTGSGGAVRSLSL